MFELLGYAPVLDFRITPFFVKVSSKRTQMIKEKKIKISLFSVLENKKKLLCFIWIYNLIQSLNP